MKTILLLLLSFSATYAQTITETLDSFEKKYYNIFTQNGSTLKMSFVKEYEYPSESDTEHYFTISINNLETESTSTTYGGMFIGDLLGSGISSTYQTFEYGGAVVLDLDSLEELYSCANSIYSYINSRPSIPNSLPTTASCSTSGIKLHGEYTPTTSYYFIAGDASFKMPPDDFIAIMKVIQKSLRTWKHLPE